MDKKELVVDVLQNYVAEGYRRERIIDEISIDDIAEDIVKLFAIHNVVDSCRCTRCGEKHHDCLNGKMCYVCDNVTQGN